MTSLQYKAILAAVQSPVLSSEMIDYVFLKHQESKNAFYAWALYEAAAAGNRKVAASIAEALSESGGLNKVHQDVLKASKTFLYRADVHNTHNLHICSLMEQDR